MFNEEIMFKKIQSIVNITDSNYLKMYFCELYKDLSLRNQTHKGKGISLMTFLDFLNIPLIIGEKLFNSLDCEKKSFLSYKEFEQGLYDLYLGDFDKTLSFIFKILDFSKSGAISRHDVKLILMYLPIQLDSEQRNTKEIDQLIINCFGKKETLTLKEFHQITESNESDIFLHLLSFLYLNCPLKNSHIENFKNFQGSEVIEVSVIQRNKTLPLPKISNFLTNSIFHNFNTESESAVRKSSSNSAQSSKSSDNQNHSSESQDNHNKSKIESNTIHLSLKRDSICRNTIYSIIEELKHEDYIYKITKTKSIKKFYVVLIGRELFYYKNDSKKILKGFHNLLGCYVTLDKENLKIDDNITLHSFKMIKNGVTKNYYTLSRESVEKWVEVLNKALGNHQINEKYEFLKEIGKGSYGKVYLSKDRNTNEKVAIKILKKEKMSTKVLQMFRYEIDIMKNCNHKNVTKLIDSFENSINIYIVMEYVSGGDLRSFISNLVSPLSESKAILIISQISTGLKYLHDRGIIHRDLKPDNILLTHDLNVKIMDFGLSKIMSYTETCLEGVGTINYLAPEVISKKPYNSKVDMWSLGIIIYFILTKFLPFEDIDSKEENIAALTLYSKLEFPRELWSERSKSCKLLITACLEKNPDKRISIKDFLKNGWCGTLCTIDNIEK